MLRPTFTEKTTMESSAKPKKVPYYRKPDHLSVEEWQTALRHQFALDQKFTIKNLGTHPVFSDFEVHNPQSGKTYKVSIRDNETSFNFCSCPDFKVNGLGTCKHIENLLHKLSQSKRNQRYLEATQKQKYSSLSIHYGMEQRVFLKKISKEPYSSVEQNIFDEDGFLIAGRIPELKAYINNVLADEPEFRVYPDVWELIERYDANEARVRRVKEIFPMGSSSDIFEELIGTELFPYQREGVIRMVEQGRILVADEMGLGKTIQAIAATEIFHRFFNVERVLIICPTSLKYQWKREIQKFSGRNADIVEGLLAKRIEQYREESFYKIISYGVTRNDGEYINAWEPQLVIIDEAQRIKNWKTQTAQSVKKITSEYTIVLTGTPLENRIQELHSIVEYIDRYKLGPLYRFLYNHQVIDDKGKLTGYKNLREINQSLKGILVRRTRKEIADQLPNRVDKNYYVEMTPEQRKIHNDYYEVVCRMVNLWIRKGFLTEEEQQKLLISLNCMRMVCDSTYLIDQKSNSGNKISDLTELIGDLTEDMDSKVVIFSQWKRMFKLIIDELDQMKIPYVYLNGDIAASDRDRMIHQFHNDKNIRVFLSTDAGGVGVNLQCANVAINVDIPWNPAVLEQRIGRIYRLGQKKHVNVFNFITNNSIEHRILHLLDFKKSVFNGTLDEEGNDTVMLEGFLDSVRSLTEISLDEFDSQPQNEYNNETITTADKDTYPIVNHASVEDASEINRTPVSKSKDGTAPNTELKPAEKVETGLFAKFAVGVKRFVRWILG